MRRLALLGFAVLAVSGQAQIWEKLLAPGLTYRMELDNNLPRIIHALRWTPKSPSVTAVPELAGPAVFEETPSIGRETISEMVRRTDAIAAINADFFPFTGDPLGMMVRNGELLSLPFKNRIAFGWGKEIAPIRAVANLTVTANGSGAVPVAQLNEECKVDSIAVNSERAGLARSASMNCVHAVVKKDSGDWQIGGRIKGTVQQLITGQKNIAIPKGSFVVTGLGTGAAPVSAWRQGYPVELSLDFPGYNGKSLHIVGGGPNLVTKGLIATDTAEAGFNADFADKRHPRTAIGKTIEGDLWLVAIDGRQKMSDGATIEELARVMQRLGCMEAINLDGGGSTTMNVFGMVMNRPSDGKEREVANGIVFYGQKPPREKGTYTINGPGAVVSGTTTYFRILDEKKQPIPNAEVLWSATGSGWIDQGGFMRATAEGTVFVSAFVRGQIVPLGITVSAPPPK